MSYLPNAEQALVERRKIHDYLLSLEHPSGKGKATFFRSHGFHPDAWEALRFALLQHVRENEVASSAVTAFGVKYVVDGLMPAPDRTHLRVRSVWFIEADEQQPRLVTAFPHRRR